MRCPQGKKTKLYKRAKLEKFAHYLLRDGLVSRLSVYQDRECKSRYPNIILIASMKSLAVKTSVFSYYICLELLLYRCSL